MRTFRPGTRLALVAALAAAVAGAAPGRAGAGQALSDECRGLWTSLQAAAQRGDVAAASATERAVAVDPICNGPLSVVAKETMLGLYRDEDVRLERAGAEPALRLARLGAALQYASAWNAWDIHVRIGDLRRRVPAADGRLDYAAVSLAYDAALRAIDLAPASARPARGEIERIAALAYQFEALAPGPVQRRATLTRTVRQINVERTPVPLQFIYDSDRLTDAGRAQAENLLSLLKEEGLPRLRLVGHTDPVGSDAYNDRLSVRRAVAVKRFLVAHGYAADRITTEGRGKRDSDKLRIWDSGQFTVDQIHQMLRRVELVWKD